MTESKPVTEWRKKVFPKEGRIPYKIYNVRYSVKSFKDLWKKLMGDRELNPVEAYTAENKEGTCLFSVYNDACVMLSGLNNGYVKRMLDADSFDMEGLLEDLTCLQNQSLSNFVDEGLYIFESLCLEHTGKRVVWIHVSKNKLYLKTIYDPSLFIDRRFSINPESKVQSNLYNLLSESDGIILYGEPGAGKSYEIDKLSFRHNVAVVHIRILNLKRDDYNEMKRDFGKGNYQILIAFISRFYNGDKKLVESFLNKNILERKLLFCFDGVDLLPSGDFQQGLTFRDILKKFITYLVGLEISLNILITARRKDDNITKLMNDLFKTSIREVCLKDVYYDDLFNIFKFDFLVMKYCENSSERVILMGDKKSFREFQNSLDKCLIKNNSFNTRVPLLSLAVPFLSGTTLENADQLYCSLLRQRINHFCIEYVESRVEANPLVEDGLKQFAFLIMLRHSKEFFKCKDQETHFRTFLVDSNDHLIEIFSVKYILDMLPNRKFGSYWDVDGRRSFWESILIQNRYSTVRKLLDRMIDEKLDVGDWQQDEIKNVMDKIITVLAKENLINVFKVFSRLLCCNVDDFKENILHVTARLGNEELTKEIIQRYPRLIESKAKESGNTPLHEAVSNGRVEIVKILCNHSEIDLADERYSTADVDVELYTSSNVYKDIVNIKNSSGETCLTFAAKVGALDIVKYLVACCKKHGLGWEECNAQGFSPFLSAVISNQIQIVRFLIDQGCCTDVESKSGFRAIHYASGDKYLEMIDILVEKDPKCLEWVTSKEYFTALHLAAGQGCLNAVKKLMAGSNVEAKDLKDRTPLHVAASRGNTDVVSFLIDQCTELNLNQLCKGEYSIFHLAAKNGRFRVVKKLINLIQNSGKKINCTTLNAHGLTPFHLAANNGHILFKSKAVRYCDIIKAFLSDGYFDVNATDKWHQTLLSFSIRQGINFPISLTDKLIKNSDVQLKNIDGYRCIHFAACQGDVEIIKNILKKLEANPRSNISDFLNSKSAKGYTPFYIVCFKHSLREVEKLLESNADFTISDENKVTPLHLACVNGKDSTVAKLLQCYKQRNLVNLIAETNNNGSTALHYAVHAGFLDVVKLLVAENKAAISVQDKNGYTPLHLAVFKDRLVIVEYLVNRPEKEDYLNKQTERGSTALHLAVQQGNVQVVKCLVKSDALTDVRDRNDHLPLHLAACQSKPEILSFLIDNTKPLRGSDGFTLFSLACKYDNLEIFKLILKKQFSISELKFSPFHLAAVTGKTFLEAVFENDATVINEQDEIGRTALYLAAWKGNKPTVEFLLSKNADISIKQKKGWGPIHVAADMSHFEIVETMVKQRGRDCVNYKTDRGDVALHFASRNGNGEMIRYLMEQGTDNRVGNEYEITPLDFAVSQSHAHPSCEEEECRRCQLYDLFKTNGFDHRALTFQVYKMENGADKIEYEVDKLEYKAVITNNFKMVEYLATELHSDFAVISTIKGWTPVHAAAAYDKIDILKYLHRLNVDLDVVAPNVKETPLFVAVTHNRFLCVEALVNMGASINMGNKDGWTPLHAAVKRDSPLIVNYLCSLNGCDINQRTVDPVSGREYCSPLYIGVQYNCINAVKELMNYLADPTVADFNDWLPLTVAEYQHDKEPARFKDMLDFISFYSHNWNSIKKELITLRILQEIDRY